jgi:cell division protein FtsZ
VDSIVIGCGGAGTRFARYLAPFMHGRTITVNDSGSDIIVDRDKLDMVQNLSSELAMEMFPWLADIDSSTVFVVAGLGGKVGTRTAELIGRGLGRRKTVIGLFSTPFRGETSERHRITESFVSEMQSRYRLIFAMSNSSLTEYYPSLPMNDAMKIHQVVMRHLLQDFERMILNSMGKLQISGMAGVGVGFGVGHERIRVAIEDALDSPWMRGNRRAVFISGAVEKEDVKVVVRNYDFEGWDVHTTHEFGEKIKATVIGYS